MHATIAPADQLTVAPDNAFLALPFRLADAISGRLNEVSRYRDGIAQVMRLAVLDIMGEARTNIATELLFVPIIPTIAIKVI